MLIVALSYVILGIGLLYPYPAIQGDVLHELPTTGLVPTATRLAMVLVVLVTAPLLIIPCAELLEGKLAATVTRDKMPEGQIGRIQSFLIRWGICLVCAAISTFVPGFVNVLSFVGCCCVAVVGFCVPPFLHLILTLQREHYAAAVRQNGDDGPRQQRASSSGQQWQFLALSFSLDGILLLWGLFATVVGAVYTFREISSSS
jgi:hypothetical protein